MTNQEPKSDGAILFTAFEPSGDDHAAAVIRELRAMHPSVPIMAWGGPKMERAGATLVERTGADAVMGMPGLAKIREHSRINERIARWMDANPVRLHVPVDSPAANFPICALARKRGIKVVHLVAPQIWAWGEWRIRKLRALTDLVLCLLPFEEGWFTTRGVPARFIGHMLFDEPLDAARLADRASRLPQGSPRLALLPGSRPSELRKNFPLLLDSFRTIRAGRPETVGCVAAVDASGEAMLTRLAQDSGGWPEGLGIVKGDTDSVIAWCEMALVVSGTVTLQVARQLRPMVAFYRLDPVLYNLIGRWVVSTRYFTLPNLIAGREVIPELVPHFGGHGAITDKALQLLADADKRRAIQEALQRVVARFTGHHAGREGARAIAEVIGLKPSVVSPVAQGASTPED